VDVADDGPTERRDVDRAVEPPRAEGRRADLRQGGVRINRSLTIPTSELRVRFGPSGGPGGQHANKVATRVELRFDVARSPSLGPVQRARLLERLGPEVRVVVDTQRSQMRNREEAVERLRARLAEGLRVTRRRTPTRPTRASVERRLDEKRRRGARKRSRRAPPDE